MAVRNFRGDNNATSEIHSVLARADEVIE